MPTVRSNLDNPIKDIIMYDPSNGPPPPSIYNLDTYFGRLRNLLESMHPRYFFTSFQTIVNHQREYTRTLNGQQSLPIDTLLTHQRYISATTNQNIDGIIPRWFRMSGFVLSNVPIVLGMIVSRRIPMILFWQFINQSYNAGFNYYHRSGSSIARDEETGPTWSPETMNILRAYVLATASSLFVAWALKKGSSKIKNIAKLPHWIVPYSAVASAGVANIFFMRSSEYNDGATIYNGETNEEIGTSKYAGKLNLTTAIFTRALLMPLPILVIPSLFISRFIAPFFAKFDTPRLILEAATITGALTIALPMTVALFPGTLQIPVDKVKEEFDKEGVDVELPSSIYVKRGI